MHDIRILWKYLNIIVPKNIKNGIKSFLIDSVLEINEKAIETTFNECFVENICENIALGFGQNEEFHLDSHVLVNVSYHIPMIKSVFTHNQLKNINAHKATGPDGITAEFMKAGALVISALVISHF